MDSVPFAAGFVCAVWLVAAAFEVFDVLSVCHDVIIADKRWKYNRSRVTLASSIFTLIFEGVVAARPLAFDGGETASVFADCFGVHVPHSVVNCSYEIAFARAVRAGECHDEVVPCTALFDGGLVEFECFGV